MEVNSQKSQSRASPPPSKRLFSCGGAGGSSGGRLEEQVGVEGPLPTVCPARLGAVCHSRDVSHKSQCLLSTKIVLSIHFILPCKKQREVVKREQDLEVTGGGPVSPTCRGPRQVTGPKRPDDNRVKHPNKTKLSNRRAENHPVTKRSSGSAP